MDIKLHFLRIKHVHDTQGFSSMQPLQSSRQSYTMANIALHIISIAPPRQDNIFQTNFKGWKIRSWSQGPGGPVDKKKPRKSMRGFFITYMLFTN